MLESSVIEDGQDDLSGELHENIRANDLSTRRIESGPDQPSMTVEPCHTLRGCECSAIHRSRYLVRRTGNREHVFATKYPVFS